MVPNSMRLLVGALVLGVWLAPAFGQDSGQFYKKPETTAELWRAMKHEIEVGDFKLAGSYLKSFIAKNPSDEELLQIQEREGSSAFLRLLTIPELSGDAKQLIEHVNDVVQTHLANRGRLDRLINNLNGDPEERDYAIAQLQRSGAAAAPAIVAALIRTSGRAPQENAAIASALPRLGKDTIRALAAALDVDDASVKLELVEVLRRAGDSSAAPYLWHLSASPNREDMVRAKARETLAAFLGTHPDRLPQAKVALTELAERYYRHQVKFPTPAAVRVWRWDGKQLVAQTVSGSEAEEYYGLRFARQALDIDPSFRPAQIVFLSMLLDRGSARPGVRDLARSASPELIMNVLDRALNDHQVTVILPSAATLGDLAEVRAVRPAAGAGQPVLVRALDYPDRRVQMVAADAILRIPGPAAAPASSRVIEILRGALAGDNSAKSKGKVLVAFANAGLGNQIAASVQRAGYEAALVQSGRETLQRLHEGADIDVLIVDSSLPDPGLPMLLAQLRADKGAGGLPLLLTATTGLEPNVRPIVESYQNIQQASPEEKARTNQPGGRFVQDAATLARRFGEESANVETALRRVAEHYRNVTVISAEQALDNRALASMLERQTADPATKPLAGTERQEGAAKAIEWLARLARGEVPGYDVQPAEGAILNALRSQDLAGLAVEATGGLRGRTVQRELAALVQDAARPEELRSAAAVELCRQIQRNGRALTEAQAKGMEKLYDAAPDSKLKANVALVVGSLRPSPREAGLRLESYTPKLPPPPKPPAPAPKPKEKRDDDDKGDK